MARALYTAYQARDWATAETFLHPDVVLDMPATGERLVGREQVLRFQREYPEPWGELVVRRALGDESSAAAEVEIRAPDGGVFRMAAIWGLRDGLLASGDGVLGGSGWPPAAGPDGLSGRGLTLSRCRGPGMPRPGARLAAACSAM